MPLLCDIRMPGTDGLTFLSLSEVRACSAVIIIMSACGSLDTASSKKGLTQRQGAFTTADIIHVSHSINTLLRQVEKIAASEASVLITGETGTLGALVNGTSHLEALKDV